ncbi:lamin-B receptor [Culicoides brevitarsis]|uniref:lamin-B receptor n=1 Tax=Culicoides brevitarsis TaxID=469753 RepID=UPI00307C0729
MSDKRRATRYGAFFESADKVASSKTEKPRKSPSRNEAAMKREQSASPVKKTSKSRPASKSPARSRGRPKSKSPARVVKKETKKPVKKEVEEVDEKKAAKKKEKTPNVVIEKLKTTKTSKDEKKSPKSAEKKEKTKTSPKVTRRSPARSAKLTAKSAIDSDPDFSPRPVRKTRKDAAAELRKSASVSQSRSVVDASPEYSDTDDVELTFKRRPVSKLDEFKEFGGQWGCLLMLLLLPLVTYGLHYYCNGRTCSFRKPNLNDFKQLSTYYNLDLLKFVLPFFLGVFTLNMFPLGRVIKVHTDRGYSEYTFNGLTLAVLSGVAVVVAEYFKYNVVDTVLRNYNQLVLLYLVNALVQSVFAYVRSSYVAQTHWNPFAKTGNFLCDFFVGREINPKWFSLVDVKLVHYHLSVITTLLLNCFFLYKNVKFPVLETELELKMHEKALYLLQSAKFDVAPLVLSLLVVVYCLDLLVFEHHLSKTFELQYEGVGAGCLLRYAVFPFLTSFVAKYVFDFKVKLDCWVLCVLGTVFLLALVTKRLANKTKNDFRWNPSKSLKVKSIPTFQGSRLLVDGLWKTVRQPNYTADVLCYLSLLLVVLGRFAWPPVVAVVFSVALLVHRALRLDARHANRYDSAWQRYCTEVKNLLVPYVF